MKKITVKRLEKYGFVLDEDSTSSTISYYNLDTKDIPYEYHDVYISLNSFVNSITATNKEGDYFSSYVYNMQEVKDFVLKYTGKKLKKLPQYRKIPKELKEIGFIKSKKHNHEKGYFLELELEDGSIFLLDTFLNTGVWVYHFSSHSAFVRYSPIGLSYKDKLALISDIVIKYNKNIKNKSTLAGNGNIIGPPKKEKEKQELSRLEKLEHEIEDLKKSFEHRSSLLLEKINYKPIFYPKGSMTFGECESEEEISTFSIEKEPFVVSVKYADAFCALNELIKLRDEVRNGWLPDLDSLKLKYTVCLYDDGFKVESVYDWSEILSFKDNGQVMAFINKNADLLERIKPLYK